MQCAARTIESRSYLITSNCRWFSNISQTLLLYKTWVCYDKFQSTKCLGVCYRYAKIPRCGYVEHGLNDITFYVEKHIAPRTICYNHPLVPDKPLRAPAFARLLYHSWFNSHSTTLHKIRILYYHIVSVLISQSHYGSLKNNPCTTQLRITHR